MARPLFFLYLSDGQQKKSGLATWDYQKSVSNFFITAWQCLLGIAKPKTVTPNPSNKFLWIFKITDVFSHSLTKSKAIGLLLFDVALSGVVLLCQPFH